MLSVQMVKCRQIPMRLESVMDLEYKLLRRFVSRGRFAICLNFSFFISFNSLLGVHYVRCLENGHFVGLVRSLFKSRKTMFDIVMNHDDYSILSAEESRRHPNDFDAVTSAWDCVQQDLKSLMDEQVQNLSFCLVMDNEKKTLIRSFNCDHLNVHSAAHEVAQKLTHDLPRFDSFLEHGISVNDDLAARNEALNCIPNLSIGNDPHKKISQALFWQMQSPRFIWLRALSKGELTHDVVDSSMVLFKERTHRNVTSRATTSRSTTSRGRRQRKARIGNADFDEVPFDLDDVRLDVFDGGTVRSFASLHSKSLVSRVRTALIQYGVFRVLRNEDTRIEVVWNSYDPKTGDLRRLLFSTTSVLFARGSTEPKYVCEKCPSYNHSVEISVESDDDAVVVGYCAHTQLLGTLVPHLRASPVPVPRNDHFIKWMQENQSSKKNVIKVFDEGGLGKFFVKVGDGLARLEHTSEVAVCCVWLRNSGPGQLSCSVSRCVEVTMKGLKKVKTSRSLCCHLRSLLEDDEYKHSWGTCLTQEGFDVGSVKELDSAMQDMEGMKKCCFLSFVDLSPETTASFD
jgi:hypothetical protein